MIILPISTSGILSFSLIRTLWLHSANLDNPGYSPQFKIPNLITSTKSLWPYKITYSEVPSIRTWSYSGSHYSDYQKEGDLTVDKSGKYLVQYNILNTSFRYSLFRHHDQLLRFFLLFLLISKIITRCMERGALSPLLWWHGRWRRQAKWCPQGPGCRLQQSG